MKKGYRLVVDATESTLKDIDSGKIRLTTEKGGKVFSQIREANGHYGSKLPIKKEVFNKGIDPAQIANSLQLKAMQDQIQEIGNQLIIIGQSIGEVLQGQQNDRIAFYYSGVALFLEARNISDNEMRTALTSQALRALSEATFQLTLTMQADIQYLVNGEYNQAKGKSVDLIDSHMHNINRAFSFIHQSTMLRAGIYCNTGELVAMATVLDEYSRFIEGTIVSNAPLLAQCDISDTGTEDGIWKSRARLKLDVSDFTKQLKSPEKAIYLGVSKEN